MAQYNFKNPAVKRLMREAQELKDATDQYSARPLEDNLFEWHFTFRGPGDTDFSGGIYHGRIILPPEYPMKPPSILLLTPNGRFELNKKICLSISGYHPESWQPSWSIRTAILAIIGFLPSKGEGAIGALEYTPEERQTLARKSKTWSCPTCGPIKLLLSENATSVKSESEIRDEQLAKQINFSNPKPPVQSKESEPTNSASVSEDQNLESQSHTHTEDNELRRRVVEPPQVVSQPKDSQVTSPPPRQTAPLQPHQEDTTSFMLIIILSVVFAVLLLRRLDRVYDLQSNIPDLF